MCNVPNITGVPASDFITLAASWVILRNFIFQKVEQASDFAAAQAFGKARTNKTTKASILQTVDQLHDHDAAYDEGLCLPLRLFTNEMIEDLHAKKTLYFKFSVCLFSPHVTFLIAV